jgi:hypothetical protein
MIYELRNKTEYPHRNPMLRPNQVLLDGDTTEDFFHKIQFPIGCTFAQNTQGLVTRNFNESAFKDGESFTSKKFFLVNLSKTKALSIFNCKRLVVEDFDKTQDRQQFQLTENDEIVSPSCSSKAITANVDCLHGNMLLLDSVQSSNAQKWRFYRDGIVNLECGRKNGNLAITAITVNNLFTDIPSLDDVELYISNVFSRLAISVGDSVSRTALLKCFGCKLTLFTFNLE